MTFPHEVFLQIECIVQCEKWQRFWLQRKVHAAGDIDLDLLTALQFVNTSVIFLSSSHADSGDIFTRAVQAVILDEGFQVESLQARTALKTASLVLEWCREQDHGEKLDSFSHILVVWLKVCFASQHTTVQLQKEWMWGAYHQLRTAETFVKDWRTFSADFVSQKAFPAFSSLLHTPFSSG